MQVLTRLSDCLRLFFYWFVVLMVPMSMACTEALPLYVPNTVYLLVTLVCVALMLPCLRQTKPPLRYVTPAVLVVAMSLVYILSWNSRKVFLYHLYSVHPGMTVQQVENIMEPYKDYHIGPPNTRRTPAGELVLVDPTRSGYRHADVNDGTYNGDIGVVKFENGRVSSVVFLPD